MMTKMNGTEPTAAMVPVSNDFKMALEPNSFEQALKFAATVAKTGICGVKSAEEVLIRIATGRELGLTAMQSLRQVYVIEGRPALDASLIVGLCLASPVCEYFECIESTAEKATWRAKRRGRNEQTLSWTQADSDRAELAGRGTHKKYPAAMKRARAASALARMVFPDVLAGFYGREELEDGEVPPAVVANEMTGEIVTPGAPARDFDGEASAFKTRIADVADSGNRESKKQLREDIAASDIPSPWIDDIKAAYNNAFAPKAAAQ